MNEEIEVAWNDPEADIDMLLAEIPEGYKVQIKRTEPDWCIGVVATVDYDPTDPVSAKWIVSRYGGRKYQIKVLDERGRYKHIRSITFPDPPLKDGAPIVPGTNGSYIFASEAVIKEPAHVPPPPPPQQDMSGLFRTMLEMQTQQANSMQTLMMTLLTKTLDSNNNAVPAPVVANPIPTDPQSQLKSTVETVKAFEELKEIFNKGNSGGGEGTDESGLGMYAPLIEKAMEKLINPPAQTAQPDPRQPPPPRELSNLEVAQLAKERMGDMPEQERNMLLSHVFNVEEEESPVVTGQEDPSDPQSLLSQEDLETLENDNSGENDDPTIPPCDGTTVP